MTAKTETLHTTSTMRKPTKKSSEAYAKFNYRERFLTSMATLIRGKKSRVVLFEAIVAQVVRLGEWDGDRLGKGRVTHCLTMVREQLIDENILETGPTKAHLQFCVVPFLLLFSSPGLLSIAGNLTTTTPTQRKKLWSTFHGMLIFRNMSVTSLSKRKAAEVCDEPRVFKKVRFSDVPSEIPQNAQKSCSCASVSRPPFPSPSFAHASSSHVDSLDDDMDEDEDLTDGKTSNPPPSTPISTTEVEDEMMVENLLLMPSNEELRAELDESVRRERGTAEDASKLRDDVKALKTKLETADEEHLRVRGELAGCRVTLELAEARVHDAERKEAVSTTELGKTSAELETLRQELLTTRERIKSLEKEAEDAEKKAQTLSLLMRAIKDSAEMAEMSLAGGST